MLGVHANVIYSALSASMRWGTMHFTNQTPACRIRPSQTGIGYASNN